MRRSFVPFGGTTRAVGSVFEAPSHRVEGVTNGDVHVFVGVVVAAVTPHHHFLAGDGDVDTDVVGVAFVLMVMG